MMFLLVKRRGEFLRKEASRPLPVATMPRVSFVLEATRPLLQPLCWWLAACALVDPCLTLPWSILTLYAPPNLKF